MKRENILRQAENTVTGDRATTYGPAKDHFQAVAKVWTEILGAQVDADQVPLCMAALKIIRLAETPGHVDSWVDLAGYAAIGGEVATETNGVIVEVPSPIPGAVPAATDSVNVVLPPLHDVADTLPDEMAPKPARKVKS